MVQLADKSLGFGDRVPGERQQPPERPTPTCDGTRDSVDRLTVCAGCPSLWHLNPDLLCSHICMVAVHFNAAASCSCNIVASCLKHKWIADGGQQSAQPPFPDLHRCSACPVYLCYIVTMLFRPYDRPYNISARVSTAITYRLLESTACQLLARCCIEAWGCRSEDEAYSPNILSFHSHATQSTVSPSAADTVTYLVQAHPFQAGLPS